MPDVAPVATIVLPVINRSSALVLAGIFRGPHSIGQTAASPYK
jgi:hypothetical protein